VSAFVDRALTRVRAELRELREMRKPDLDGEALDALRELRGPLDAEVKEKAAELRAKTARITELEEGMSAFARARPNEVQRGGGRAPPQRSNQRRRARVGLS
jgi:hypothetical protein